MLNLKLDLEDLAACIRRNDRRVSRLVAVPGLTDLAFDLYCNPGDTFANIDAFLQSDLVTIRKGLERTCKSKERFNELIAVYIRVAADNYRVTVRLYWRGNVCARCASKRL